MNDRSLSFGKFICSDNCFTRKTGIGLCYILFALFLVLLIVSSCSNPRVTDPFAMQRMGASEDSIKKDMPVYLQGTLPIDSLDPSLAIYDVFRIDISDYGNKLDKPDTIQLYARVYDSLGNFITNMADPYKKFPDKEYFTYMEEKLGRHYRQRTEEIPKYHVREFGSGDSIAYSLSLTVDYSGSMEMIKETISEGAELMAGMKFPYDRLSIATFNREYDLKVPMMVDKDSIITLFRSVKDRNFGLFSAVNDAVGNSLDQLMKTPKDAPRALVVFSDGDDNYSYTEIGPIIEKAKEENVNIFSIAFGYSEDQNLKYMAEYTGGKFYKARSKEELLAIFRDIYMSLRFYYLITYTPPEYWGYHQVRSDLSLDGLDTVLSGYAEYDSSELFPWTDLEAVFERPIVFEFNKSDLLPESLPIIDEIIDAMLSRPTLRLEIRGHTDNVGSQEYNQPLSEARAQVVMDAIAAAGIAPNRLRSRGFGASMPIATNETEEGRSQNRRTEFVVIAK